MAYISRETIAANGEQSLTVPPAAKWAIITARGGNFSYTYGGDAPTAATWYGLTPLQLMELAIEDIGSSPLRFIRDANDSGTLYVSYFDVAPRARVTSA